MNSLFHMHYCNSNKALLLVSLLLLRRNSLSSCYSTTFTTTTSTTTEMCNDSRKMNDKTKWGVLEQCNNHDDHNNNIQCFRLYMQDDGIFPNNIQYPLLLFRRKKEKQEEVTSCSQDNSNNNNLNNVRNLITSNGWSDPWIWGIYPYHHYHSNAWELLYCIDGNATIQLGGDNGPITTIVRNDLIYIPPGIAHKQLNATNNFQLYGSYPPGISSTSVDVLKGKPTEKQRNNIRNCPIPKKDPIYNINLSKYFMNH